MKAIYTKRPTECRRCGRNVVDEKCAGNSWGLHTPIVPGGVDPDYELKPGQLWALAGRASAKWTLLEAGERVFESAKDTEWCDICDVHLRQHYGQSRCYQRGFCPSCNGRTHYDRECLLKKDSPVAIVSATDVPVAAIMPDKYRHRLTEYTQGDQFVPTSCGLIVEVDEATATAHDVDVTCRECLIAVVKRQHAEIEAAAADPKNWRMLAVRRRLRLRALQTAVAETLRADGKASRAELQRVLDFSKTDGAGPNDDEKRLDAMERAIRIWIKKHEAHGPSANDVPDIHWPLYEADYKMFEAALKGIEQPLKDPAA